MRAAFAISTLLLVSTAEAHDWRVEVFNISPNTYIRASVNGKELGKCKAGEHCNWSLTPALQNPYSPQWPGNNSPAGPIPKYMNDLDIMVVSRGVEWTLGYEIFKNGLSVRRDVCGKVGQAFCPFGRPDPQQINTVFQTIVLF